MRFLLGWTVKLGLVAVVGLMLAGHLRIQLSDEVLEYKLPESARQWVDRNVRIGDIAARTRAGFNQIADSFK
ncbi:MAG: hypothetical protein ACOY4R_21210 [Pseudomonadota bacterium]